MSFHRWLGNAHYFGHLLVRKPGKEAQLHDLRLRCIVSCQMIQRLIEGQQLLVIDAGREIQAVEIYPLRTSPVAEIILAPGIIDEDAAHGLGGGAKKMRAILPLNRSVAAEAQPRLVDEGGGLERVSGGFAGEFGGGDLAKFAVE